MQAEAEGLCVAAEGESQIKAENLIEQIFDQVGGFDVVSFQNGIDFCFIFRFLI